jgi:hypothetical protein
MNIRGKMRMRAQARYEVAIEHLVPDEDGAYATEEVAEKMADQVAIDARAMQLRQAKADLEMLRHEDDDEPGNLQLNLFGEGRLIAYDPHRLVLGPNDRIIAHHLAPLEYKEAERDRAREHLELAQAKEAIKAREVLVFGRWVREQLASGRNIRTLTWGNCIAETGILRQRSP